MSDSIKYRLLNEGETINEGDEDFILRCDDRHTWEATRAIGCKAGAVYPHRRPMTPAEAAASSLFAHLEDLLEQMERPPAPSCSCHLSPPCSDCVDYSGLREAIQSAEHALAAAKEGGGEQ